MISPLNFASVFSRVLSPKKQKKVLRLGVRAVKPILGCVAFFILVVVYREPETRQTFRSFVQAWQKGIGLAFQTPESVFENKFRP